MKLRAAILLLPFTLVFLSPAVQGGPYSKEYLAARPVPEDRRVPNVKGEQWMAVDARPGFARFVDADSVFIHETKGYYSISVRRLTVASRTPFGGDLPDDAPFGSELGGRVELDCAHGQSRTHNWVFGDYFLGARGEVGAEPTPYRPAAPLDISIFCISDRAKTLQMLEAFDKENRVKVDPSLYGRYDK